MESTNEQSRWPWYVRIIVGRNPIVTLVRAIVWAILLVVVFKYAFTGIRVRGESMEPTFHSGQVKLVNRLAYLRHPPQRGDVVAIRAPELHAVILKRVIGLPHERLGIRAGRIYVNGQQLEETYTRGRTSFKQDPPVELESNQYYLIGDNREVSDHYLKYDYQIMGKVF